MIFKYVNLIILQSPFQIKLFAHYNEDIFSNGLFYVSPKFIYQVIIIKTMF